MDGVTLGHPCCSFVHCKVPLTRTNDHFCPIHMDLNLECCVIGCTHSREPGHATRGDSQHRSREEAQSLAIRTPRSLKARIVSAHSSSRSVKARLTRSWTHNEQLMVRPCGIIIGRATFYSSESLPACKVRLSTSTEAILNVISGVFQKRFPRRGCYLKAEFLVL
jgi:hypothetical protein